MKPRMKTGVVPIKTFLVVGGKKSWQKKIWLSNSQIATTWLLLALCYNNFCNSWSEKSIEKNQSVLCTFVVYFTIFTKFYNFSPIVRLKSITFFFFFNQKFPFSIFIQFIFNSLLFQIIIFFFNELRKILLLFIYYLFFLFDSLI